MEPVSTGHAVSIVVTRYVPPVVLEPSIITFSLLLILAGVIFITRRKIE